MSALIGLLFCVLLGVTVKVQGIAALLWFPLGFIVALYISAQIILPLLLGLPRAIGLVSKRQMRLGVIIRLLVTPLIWVVLVFGVLFLVGFFWPSSATRVEANLALNLGVSLGTLSIMLSPLSKKSRVDFEKDFDRSYKGYCVEAADSPVSRGFIVNKYAEAAIKVASNLYLHTVARAKDAPATLHFTLPDSRYRYMIFCLSSVATSALAFDENKEIDPEALIKGCLYFAALTATQFPQEYFDDPANARKAAERAEEYLEEFLKHWARWPALQKEGRNGEIVDLISSMIHSAESNQPISQADNQRLGPLALEIDCGLLTMREALVELANR